MSPAELHIWLKSLRLHKYTAFLLEFTYEELVNLTADDLPKDRVTEGAKGKILKEIALVNERPATIRSIAQILEVSVDARCDAKGEEFSRKVNRRGERDDRIPHLTLFTCK